MDGSVDVSALTRVWERVSAPTRGLPDESPEDRSRSELARSIRNASAARGMYSLLAMKTRSSNAERTFRKLALEEADSEKRLQAEFFLLTGDTCAAPTVHPSAPSVPGAIREAYHAELENSRRLMACAGQAGESGTSELLRELALRERAHAAALRELLERMI